MSKEVGAGGRLTFFWTLTQTACLFVVLQYTVVFNVKTVSSVKSEN